MAAPASFADISDDEQLCASIDTATIFAAIGLDDGIAEVSSPGIPACALTGTNEMYSAFSLVFTLPDDGHESAASAIPEADRYTPDGGVPDGAVLYGTGGGPQAIVDVHGRTVHIANLSFAGGDQDLADLVVAVESLLD